MVILLFSISSKLSKTVNQRKGNLMKNKHNHNTLVEMAILHKEGLSSRQIANHLGISKSSVNDNLKKILKGQKIEYIGDAREGTSKYLFIDIETSPDIAVTFKRFKANLNQDNILQEGGVILSISWRWMNENVSHGLALTPAEAILGNDKRICAVLYALIETANVIIGHNIDRFDLPVIKSRTIINKMEPLKKVKTIDTLKLAKQMRFQSNRLGSLGVALGEGDKASHSGISTWIGCLAGNKESLNEMLQYNIQDVDLLYAVYHRLAPHSNLPVNSAIFTKSTVVTCPVCSSTDIHKTENSVYTKACEYEEYECGNCGSRSRSRKSMTTKDKRLALLT